jgi:hypothetical protein
MIAIHDKFIALALPVMVATVCWISPCVANDVAVRPIGVYAEIDIQLTSAAVQTLSTGSNAAKAKVIATVQENAKEYAPPAFYALSKALFDEGQKDEGAFWFYAGQLRGRFDANRCADASAREAIDVLNDEYGTPINQYMFQRPGKLAKLIDRVVDWDKKTPHNYDPRWINLHGMNAMTAAMSGKVPTNAAASMSIPSSQWAEIEEQTRADYLSGFKEAMAQLKSQKN